MGVSLTDGRYGPIAFFNNDIVMGSALSAYGEWFEAELNIARKYLKLGDAVIDVGAHLGTQTQGFASIVGPKGLVIALEPQKPLFMLLCGNCAMGEHFNVIPIRAAAGATQELVALPVYDYNSIGSFGGYSLNSTPDQHPGCAQELIQQLQLDLFAEEKTKFIKIDAEGYESEVLKGAVKLISKHKPVLFIEDDRLDKSKELIAALRNLDYTELYWVVCDFFNPDNIHKNQEIIPIHEKKMVFNQGQWWLNGMSVNILALPDNSYEVPEGAIPVNEEYNHPCLNQSTTSP